MRIRLYIFMGVLVVGLSAGRARSATALSSLTNPTLQTLIDLGSDGVTVGPLRFHDFVFDTVPFSASPKAGIINVLPVITPSDDGLRFTSTWVSFLGGSTLESLSYSVDVVDPGQAITTVSLICNGTVNQPVNGTSVSTSLTARSASGVQAGRSLATTNDGQTAPIDTTHPDNSTDSNSFAALTSLTISDSISLNSGIGTPDGIASASVIENSFDPTPLPAPNGLIFIPCAMIASTLRRRSQRSILRSMP